MIEHEALCILRDPVAGWGLTAAYRSGQPSVLNEIANRTPFGPPVLQDFQGVARDVTQPCVLIETARVCQLTNPDQVYALAQWLVAASIQLTADIDEMFSDEEEEEEDDE
jgi:hypothetical protein